MEKEKLIELYNIIFPRSLEDYDDIKAMDMDEILRDGDTVVIKKMSEIKVIADWMVDNGLWSFNHSSTYLTTHHKTGEN